MKRFNDGIKWTLAAVLFAGITAGPVMAEKTTPATGKNSAVPAVPRAIPDLLPYHKFDPPKSKLFDISKLTISGDLRVRPEFRTNTGFAGNSGPKNNTFVVQQWARLGFNYSISPDVTFFLQGQHSKNWGVNATVGGGTRPGAGTDANGTAGTLFARQAYMLVRNFLIPNLTIKAGRQLVVWGNHRMFGHFDWNNVGWSHDGLTMNYKLSKSTTLQVGWLRTAERNCPSPTSGNCIPNVRSNGSTGPNASGPLSDATDDGNVVYVRAPMKVAGVVLEPTYIWHDGGTGPMGNMNAPRPMDQSRHTLGGRAVKKFGAGGARVDLTLEGYYQFGEIGAMDMDIEAYAFHIDGGVTLPVPMQPRLSAEFNMASGNKDGDNKWRSFDQLYPTNHIHFGYMDRMSWKNMNHLAFGLQMRPNADSHFEVTGHIFNRQESTDGVYHAGQAQFISATAGGSATSVGEEVDIVYTHFFTPGNHVAWQIGGGVFLPGDVMDNWRDGDAGDQSWGYTQLWVNF